MVKKNFNPNLGFKFNKKIILICVFILVLILIGWFIIHLIKKNKENQTQMENPTKQKLNVEHSC